LVLNLSGKKAVPKTPQDIFVLDTAFALIEGHPLLLMTARPKGSATRPLRNLNATSKHQWIRKSGKEYSSLTW
jgi:hypothetical protein